MKILIISGFLGAGKTTFIKELIQRSSGEIAILENEFGELGMDKDKLESTVQKEEINIWELAEGCICCSTKKDFASTILTIANAVDPEFLIIEPTGVGMLGNIINNIKQIEYERISLLAPVTIVDGYSCRRYMEEYPQMYQNQIKYARTILLSKMENATSREREEAVSHLSEINKDADIISEHYTKLDRSWWDKLFSTAYDGSSVKEESVNWEGLESFSLSDIRLPSPISMVILLENLIRGEFGEIIRAKGSLGIGRIELQFDMVEGRYSVIVMNDAQENHDKILKPAKVVFFGKGIQRQKLRRYLFSASTSIKIRRRL